MNRSARAGIRSFRWRGTQRPERSETRAGGAHSNPQSEDCGHTLGNDDAAFFALKFLGLRELAA
jgi:hypothetical protein